MAHASPRLSWWRPPLAQRRMPWIGCHPWPSRSGRPTFPLPACPDNAAATDDNDTTATINEKPCCFEVLIPPGFGIGLKAEVTEICEESHTGVPWEFKITGGLIVIPISPLTGTADFAAGETKTIKAPLVIGLGNIQITFTIGEYCDPTIVNARIIGPFVIVS